MQLHESPQSSSIQPKIPKCSLIQLNTAQCSSVQLNAAQYGSKQLNTAQYSSIQLNAAQYSSIQLNTAQCSSIQLKEAQYGSATWKINEYAYVLDSASSTMNLQKSLKLNISLIQLKSWNLNPRLKSTHTAVVQCFIRINEVNHASEPINITILEVTRS